MSTVEIVNPFLPPLVPSFAPRSLCRSFNSCFQYKFVDSTNICEQLEQRSAAATTTGGTPALPSLFPLLLSLPLLPCPYPYPCPWPAPTTFRTLFSSVELSSVKLRSVSLRSSLCVHVCVCMCLPPCVCVCVCLCVCVCVCANNLLSKMFTFYYTNFIYANFAKFTHPHTHSHTHTHLQTNRILLAVGFWQSQNTRTPFYMLAPPPPLPCSPFGAASSSNLSQS